jgi:hypothetical protein
MKTKINTIGFKCAALLATCLALTSLLSGCASQQEMQVKFRAQSDGALCLGWMTAPSINIWQSEREAEIARRGLDCWKYGDVARARQAADDSFQRGLNQMQQQAQPQVRPPIQTNCYRSGAYTNCTSY